MVRRWISRANNNNKIMKLEDHHHTNPWVISPLSVSSINHTIESDTIPLLIQFFQFENKNNHIKTVVVIGWRCVCKSYESTNQLKSWNFNCMSIIFSFLEYLSSNMHKKLNMEVNCFPLKLVELNKTCCYLIIFFSRIIIILNHVRALCATNIYCGFNRLLIWNWKSAENKAHSHIQLYNNYTIFIQYLKIEVAWSE